MSSDEGRGHCSDYQIHQISEDVTCRRRLGSQITPSHSEEEIAYAICVSRTNAARMIGCYAISHQLFESIASTPTPNGPRFSLELPEIPKRYLAEAFDCFPEPTIYLKDREACQ